MKERRRDRERSLFEKEKTNSEEEERRGKEAGIIT